MVLTILKGVFSVLCLLNIIETAKIYFPKIDRHFTRKTYSPKLQFLDDNFYLVTVSKEIAMVTRN